MGGPFGASALGIAAAASEALPTGQATADATTAIMQNLEKAMHPDLGGGGGMIPGTTLPTPKVPLPPAQYSPEGMIPQGPFASVNARKRADMQAAFSGVANIIQTAQQHHYQQKVQNLQQDFETLQNAYKGYNEGKATGNKEMMEHNARIINSIVGDEKKSKALGKAFDVNMNPMAEGKGKDKQNPANEAWKNVITKGMKEDPMLSPRSQMMMARMPQTLQMDPRLAAQAQLVKDKLLPTADAKVQAYSRMADAVIQGASRVDAATINRQSALLMKSATLAAARLSSATRLTAENQRHQNAMLEIAEKHRLAMQELNPLKQAQMLNSISKTIDDTIGKVKLDSNGNVVESSGYQGQIRELQKEIEDTRSQMSMFGKSPFMLDSIDEILASKHPFLMYGATQKEVEGLRKIKSLQQDIGILQNEMKSLTATRIGIGRATADVAAKGVYGRNTGAADDVSDSERVSGGDDSNGADDAGAAQDADTLERSFGYKPED